MTIKKIYTNNFAPNPLRVNLMLQVKGIEFECVEIDLTTGQQLSPEYKEISPEGTVPALVLNDGTVLTDVIAILHYIEHSFPESRKLMGLSPLEQAQVLGMMHSIYFGGLMAIAEILRNGFMPGFEGRALPANIEIKQIPELMDRGHNRIQYFYQQMNQKLTDREFLIGNQLTQADIDLYVLCNFAGFVKEKFDVEKCPNLASYYKNIKALLS